MATIGVTLQTGSGQKPSVTNPAARVMQMKCDRRCGNRVSAVMYRRDTERRGEFLITIEVNVVDAHFAGFNTIHYLPKVWVFDLQSITDQ